MNELSLEQMDQCTGGCGDIAAAGSVLVSSAGLAGAGAIVATGSLVFAPFALIMGAGALAVTLYCSE